MGNPTDNLTIFHYLDYRAYLKDYCMRGKRLDPSFSYTIFFQKAGLPANNTTLLSRVIAGQRNLTQALRFRFAKALGLRDHELRYFDLLVQFNQTKSVEEKNHFFTELSRYRTKRAVPMNEDQLDVHSRWYNHIVYAYLEMRNRLGFEKSLAEKVIPAISATQVGEAVDELLKLKLIKKVPNGYAVAEKHLASKEGIRNFQGKKAVRELTHLAMEVFDSIPATDRDYSFMTMNISEKGFAALKERLRSFREEVRVLLDKDAGEDRIYTLNMQLFPNTKVFSRRDR